MVKQTRAEADQLWDQHIFSVLNALRSYAENRLSMEDAILAVEDILGEREKEISSFLVSSISEADSDLNDYFKLIDFLSGKPSRQQMIQYLNSLC
jgi:hypothetical protein